MAVDTLKYDELLEKTFTTLNSYVESEWPVVKQTDRVTVSATPSKDGKIFKAVTEINATPKKTLEYFIPGPNRVRMQWDDTIKESNIVETIHESSIVLQTVSNSAVWGLISSRDFVDLIKWGCVEESGVCYVYGVGIDHPSCPETPNFVRGWNHPYGKFFFPTDKGQKSKVVYIIQSDLRGRLPMSLVNSFIPSALMDILKKLQTAIDAKLTAP